MENVEDRIRERAHLIWEREGRPQGRELAHWEQAASELMAEDAAAAGFAGEADAAAAGPAKKPRAPRKPKADATEAEAQTAPEPVTAAAPRRRAVKPKAAAGT